MLGVQREGVIEAAGEWQDAHTISYSLGRIRVLDLAKLELRVCECYAVLNTEFDKLLSDTPPGSAFISLA